MNPAHPTGREKGMGGMKILIAGCGYIGSAAGKRWASSGAEVWGLRRDPAELTKISGIRPLAADLLDPASLSSLPDADVVLICHGLSRESDRHETTYAKGTANLVRALQMRPPRKIVLVSSTSVYAAHDGSWVDETTDPAAGGYESPQSEENARSLLAAEKSVLESGIPSVVFRLAGIYGPGRNRLAALKAGRAKPDFSDSFTNRIHRDDIVSGILLLAADGKPGEVYLGADDRPCTQKELYDWIFACLGLEPPPPAAKQQDGPVLPGQAGAAPSDSEARHHVSHKRVSNRKIKALGLALKYPDFEKGYGELLRELTAA